MSSLLAKDYKTKQTETFYAASPVSQWHYCVLKSSFESLILASTHTRLNTHSSISIEVSFGVALMGEGSVASEGRLVSKCFVPCK